MFRRRLSSPLPAIALVLVAVLTWRGQGPRTGSVDTAELTCGVPCAIATNGDRAGFDLLAGNSAEYLLIVSSLGRADRSYTVELTAAPVAAATIVPARIVEPLPRELLPSGPQRTRPAEQPCRGSAKRPAPKRRDFYLHVTDGDLSDAKQYVRIGGRLIGEGRDVRVYLDQQTRPDQLRTGLVDEIVRSFDDEIQPRSRNFLGDCRDVDRDGAFAILITPWLERLQGGGTALGGMTRGGDFREDVAPPFGNRCDMLYLNANLAPGPHLRTLLAHEFAHAVCFSSRFSSGPDSCGLPPEEDWLSEAIAHLAEDLHRYGWSNLDHRVSRYLDEPQAAPLVVPDYYRAGLWRHHGCRGATYLFLRWCVDQFGEDLLPSLIDSPACGTANLETATGIPFEDLYRRWSIALALSGRSGGSKRSSGAAQPPRCRFDPYRSVDLFGKLGRFQLDGPEWISWVLDDGPLTVALSGTATAFVGLEPSLKTQARRIQVRAEPGARLQITLVRLNEAVSDPSNDRARTLLSRASP